MKKSDHDLFHDGEAHTNNDTLTQDDPRITEQLAKNPRRRVGYNVRRNG